MLWWITPGGNKYDGVICDGSIRSGKTVAMSVGFLLWSMRSFNSQRFALCGKTIEALRRNVTSIMPGLLEGLLTIQERRSDNTMIVTGFGHTNIYHEFGGKDESSYTLIQGLTLAGVLFDEVVQLVTSLQGIVDDQTLLSQLWFIRDPAEAAENIRRQKEENAKLYTFPVPTQEKEEEAEQEAAEAAKAAEAARRFRQTD